MRTVTNSVIPVRQTGMAKHPERILQFGEGNFLRCFIDWQVDILNEKKGLDAGVVVVRPIDTDFPPSLSTQDGLYTSVLRGYDEQGTLRNDRRLITCVNREISVYQEYDKFLDEAHNPDLRFIVSNTTEAGIVYGENDKYDDAPAHTYPAKLTRFLHERYKAFGGASDKGFILIPCELIDYNGDKLREIVLKYTDLWGLEVGFREWLLSANTFCSTLVDRIVTGYPASEIDQLQDELGYKDGFITTGEFFHFFVIQAPSFVADELGLPCDGLNILITEDLKPYKMRKVGILNGCHTALVPVAFLSGHALVKEAVGSDDLAAFLNKLLEEEIIPNLDMPEEELREYAASVVGRFKNPYINHKLLDISLNSMTKYKTRLLPQFISHYEKTGEIPALMSLALAALLCFYRGEVNGVTHPLKDDGHFLEMFKTMWGNSGNVRPIVQAVLGLRDHWDYDLTSIAGLEDKLVGDMTNILEKGMPAVLREYL